MPPTRTLSAADLRRRLAGTLPPANPTDVMMPPGSERWPGDLRQRLAGTLTPAGVLVPVLDRRGEELRLLFTERAAELRSHAGQISFPGGRMEAADTDILATALRETHEEIGIDRDQVSVLGFLEPMPTLTGYAITPVVGLVADGARLRIDAAEVASAFEVPLTFLADPANRRVREREVRGRRMALTEFEYDGHRIWGATAFIVLQFLDQIKIK
ncbi:MAG: CoA pyrophosphatase [Woeseiaceae bacterium]|nr:CoA pyrophosphatase [Woeseiaceae bacterium]